MLAGMASPERALMDALYDWQEKDDATRAAHVRAAIASSGVSRTRLAERMHVRDATVSSWANTGAGLDWYVWLAIANGLALPPTWKPTSPAPPRLRRGRPPKSARAS